MKDNLQLPEASDVREVLRLDDKKLPSFPEVAARLMEVLNDESATMEDLSKIVETDPGLSVRILEIVNSAMYGLRRKITALSEGIVYLGLNEIKKLAIEMTVFDKLFKSDQSSVFNRVMFWRHCVSVAVLSVQISKAVGHPDPEEAYVAGLLHDVGKIFLDRQGKKDYGRFIESLPATTEQIIEKEREIMGLGHDDIGAFLGARWRLPIRLNQVIKYHHQPFDHLNLPTDEKRLIAIVSLADFLCWTQGFGSFDFIHPPVLSPEIEQIIDLNSFSVYDCLDQMNLEIEKISKFYKFIFPSPDKLKENILEANLKLSKANTKYYYQEDPFRKVEMTVSKDTALSQLDFEIGKALSKAKTIQEVLDIVMYQIGRVFQPENWSILLKDQKTSDLVFSVVVGSSKEKLTGAKLKKGEGVAGYVLEKGTSVIVDDVRHDERFSQRVDKYTGFKTESIICTPLKTGKKIFGVIELINRIDEKPFENHDLELLESISEFAAIAIERAYYNQALRTLATKDSVTGLKNKWSFERAFSNKDVMLKNYGSVFSMLVIDFQGLRKINSSNYPAGSDVFLNVLANEINETKRKQDEVYRYGENTFLMILPHTYADGAERAKNRLSTQLSLITKENGQLPVKNQIFTHTIGIEEAGGLREMISKSLANSAAPSSEEKVSDLEYSLQDLLEKKQKESAPGKEKAKAVGKPVSLSGQFIRLKTGESGHVRVERLALESIGFRISRSHRIQENDFLDIKFTLDNINKDRLERRAVVREIKGNFVHAQFYNPPPYAKRLGFYLMS